MFFLFSSELHVLEVLKFSVPLLW